MNEVMIGFTSPIDVEHFFQAQSANTSSEEPLPYSLREELDKARKVAGLSTSSQPGARSSKGHGFGDWEKIIRITQDWLIHRSHDLELAARLTEALTKVHGFAGLRDGLKVLARLVEESEVPAAERPGSGEIHEDRLISLRWLDDPDRGALFPSTIRSIPIVDNGVHSYSWNDWKKIRANADSSAWAKFEAALKSTPISTCQTVSVHIEEADDELDRLEATVSREGTGGVFELSGLRRAIADCREFTGLVLENHPGSRAIQPLVGNSIGADEGPTPVSDDTIEYQEEMPPYSRDQIYELIAQLAEMLKQIEPHSPVPYLLGRAVELGALPFPQLMKELVRDQSILARMGQELGIQPTP